VTRKIKSKGVPFLPDAGRQRLINKEAYVEKGNLGLFSRPVLAGKTSLARLEFKKN
jgi:hypothetical protein